MDFDHQQSYPSEIIIVNNLVHFLLIFFQKNRNIL